MNTTSSLVTAITEAAGSNTWADQLAEKVLARFPDQPIYTCAAGISPSGIVHFGNFRDVITPYAVARALQERGKTVRMLFSWDNFDRFRKVPVGVDPAFSRYVGQALSDIPDPEGTNISYAERFQPEFEQSMAAIGIAMEYRYQNAEYKSGRYVEKIRQALTHRAEIADIMLEFKTEKANEEKGIDPEAFRAAYFPVTVYSRFTGKDKTEVLEWDGNTSLTYRCGITNNVETIDFAREPIVKLPWKVDWPMRWGEEQVHFEAGGKDHATPGSSYDVSSVVSRKIFGREPPVFQGYEFVGIQGTNGKMSGSKGGAVSPGMLLDIYEPALLKWLYLRRAPTQSFNLAFDTEIYRQYDEFDSAVKSFAANPGEGVQAMAIRYSDALAASSETHPKIPFKQAVALGQITQWNAEKLTDLMGRLNVNYDQASLPERLAKARGWLERYNPEEAIRLEPTPHAGSFGIWEPERLDRIRKLRDYMEQGPESVTELETKLYDIPKLPDMDDSAKKIAQRNFFKDVYTLLIGKETGPRLSTFLWVVDREKVLELLGKGLI